MAIKVITTININGDAERVDTYQEAHGIAMQDGHLLVQAWDSPNWATIAVYSPDRWVSAFKDGSREAGRS